MNYNYIIEYEHYSVCQLTDYNDNETRKFELSEFVESQLQKICVFVIKNHVFDVLQREDKDETDVVKMMVMHMRNFDFDDTEYMHLDENNPHIIAENYVW